GLRVRREPRSHRRRRHLLAPSRGARNGAAPRAPAYGSVFGERGGPPMAGRTLALPARRVRRLLTRGSARARAREELARRARGGGAVRRRSAPRKAALRARISAFPGSRAESVAGA